MQSNTRGEVNTFTDIDELTVNTNREY